MINTSEVNSSYIQSFVPDSGTVLAVNIIFQFDAVLRIYSALLHLLYFFFIFKIKNHNLNLNRPAAIREFNDRPIISF